MSALLTQLLCAIGTQKPPLRTALQRILIAAVDPKMNAFRPMNEIHFVKKIVGAHQKFVETYRK